MKESLKLAIFLAVPTLMVHLSGCSGSEEGDDQQTVQQDTAKKDSMEQQVFYQIPTPNELFSVMKEIGGKPNPSLLNATALAAKYTDPRQKAMAFGAYAADLAYAASYKLDKTLDYLGVIQSMSKEMEISSAFDETIFKAAEKFMNDGDSLTKLSNDVYFKAYAYLEENERGSTLGQIVAGGWIESLYLLTNVAGTYKEKDPVIQRIIDQKLNYENLWGFLMKYEEDESIKKTITEIEELGMIFDSFETKASDVAIENRDGVDVITGGTEIVPNPQSYNDLINKIKEMRNRMVSVNS